MTFGAQSSPGNTEPLSSALSRKTEASWTPERERSLSLLLRSYLAHSPEALLFFDRRGVLLYSSAQGESLLDRWNRTLRRSPESASLPAALQPAFLHGKLPLRLQHPELPRLSAALETMPGGFVLRLMEETSERPAEFSAQALAALKKLTMSEQRVARLAVEGLRNEQIAERLNRSPRTIEFQLHCSFRKLGVSNRVQLSRLLT